MIFVKRAYEPAEDNDGKRFLVDRLWPRGVSKEELKLDGWAKTVSPSNELREWFEHDPEKWDEFQRRYGKELDKNKSAWQPLLRAAQEGDIAFLFGAYDTEHNNAIALRSYLIRQLKHAAAAQRKIKSRAKPVARRAMTIPK